MSNAFHAVQISEHAHWVGAVDWAVRDFHGYKTSRGTTYNAFLVTGQGKNILIDTVKAPFREEMLGRIASVIDPKTIDVVISNHTEMDHSGNIPYILDLVKPEQFLASKKGAEALAMHFDLPMEPTVCNEGDTIEVGGLHLTFLPTPMVHWPDSMWTYLAEDKLAFCNDAFGMHLASTARFADELPDHILHHEAAKYYANILLHLSPIIGKTIDKVLKLGLPIDVLATDHGPIWRANYPTPLPGREVWSTPGKIIEAYQHWIAQKPTMKAVVAYDTMWKSTEKMARAVEEGLADGGAIVKVMPLSASHRSDVSTELLDAGAFVVGTPTINNQMFPTVAGLLCYLKGLKPKNLVAAAFGSYGWSGEGSVRVHEILKEMKLDLVDEPLRSKWVPNEERLAPFYELGKTVAARMKEKTSE